MGLKTTAAKWLAKRVHKSTQKWCMHPLETQKKVFDNLLEGGKDTLFGDDHDFTYIKSYNEFKEAVPIRDYETLRPYIKRILEGENDVLWKGKPLYFAKTSGTTSG